MDAHFRFQLKATGYAFVYQNIAVCIIIFSLAHRLFSYYFN